VYFYTLTQLSNVIIGFRIDYQRNGVSWEEVGVWNALERMNGSLIVFGAGTQNASEIHTSVRAP